MLQLRRPIPALALMLFQHPHVRHHHPPVDRLAHIVNRQQADLHGGQRFRLDAGLAVHICGSDAQSIRSTGIAEPRKLRSCARWDKFGTGFLPCLRVVYGFGPLLTSSHKFRPLRCDDSLSVRTLCYCSDRCHRCSNVERLRLLILPL